MKPNTFLFGCPRSGTTLLASIINCNKEGAILIERHNQLNSQKRLSLDCYEPPIVDDFSANASRHALVNKDLLLRVTQGIASRYGDKIPRLYMNTHFFDQEFPVGTILFGTLRNIFDIGLSYVARMASESDPWSLSLGDAIRHWNRYLERVEYLAQKHRLLIFDYDSAASAFDDFEQFQIVASLVYKAMGMRDSIESFDVEELLAVFKKARSSLPSVNKTRSARRLDPPMVQNIVLNANFSTYKRLISIGEGRVIFDFT
jgi:hypothetical protein